MSRIDEALKRVSGRGATEAKVASIGAVHGLEDKPALERYAPEAAATGSGEGYAVEGEHPVAPPASPKPAHPMRIRQVARFDRNREVKLVVHEKAPAMCVEQYRRLAGALYELQIQRDLKTVMVTSALPADGKTLTITNLALTLSESYRRRVVLVDADLRRPTVHTTFGLPNQRGLNDALRPDGGDVHVHAVTEHLDVVLAGQPDRDPMARLTSDRMRLILEQLAQEYDWVLLDAAPVGFIPDAQLLARLTGAVLFVIRAGATPHPLVTRALQEVGLDLVVGTVLNRVEAQTIPASDYYRSYYGSPD